MGTDTQINPIIWPHLGALSRIRPFDTRSTRERIGPKIAGCTTASPTGMISSTDSPQPVARPAAPANGRNSAHAMAPPMHINPVDSRVVE